MITHQLIQGTPEWSAYRAQHFNASDAPAMMGVSPYKTRSQLLHERATGIIPEVDSATQKRFDDGHRFEALARALAEEIIGDELYPVVGSEGKYSASFDGITMLEDILFEHKSLNDDIRAAQTVQDLHPMYHIQMEQQLMVSGAEKCLFMASIWDDNDQLVEEKHFWYKPDGFLRKRIVDAWSQFETDLATYSPKEINEKPIVNDIENLPAIAVQIRGEVLTSNLPTFIQKADAFIAQINTDLQTDEDFAIAEKTVKYCDKVEKELDLTKNAAIAQTASIDELLRTIDRIKEQFRTKRLVLEKLVKTQKEAIKTTAILDAKNKFSVHIADLENTIRPIRLIVDYPDLAGAAKNKRTLASLHDAIDTALANAKINASNVASALYKKLEWFNSETTGYAFLFNDLQTIVYKEAEDFILLVKSRIEGHKKAEEERIEAERKRIQAEAEEKARREAEAKAEAERELIRQEEAAKIRAEQQEIIFAPSDIEIVKAVAFAFDVALEQALEWIRLVDVNAVAERVKLLNDAVMLRQQALKKRELAQYADRSTDRQRELDEARQMEIKAAKIESEAA